MYGNVKPIWSTTDKTDRGGRKLKSSRKMYGNVKPIWSTADETDRKH